MEDTNKKRKIIFPMAIVISALALGLIIFFVIKILTTKKAEITILVAPEVAEIEIDEKIYKNGVHSFPAGKHFASISADGFSHTEFEFSLENGESFKLFEVLSEESKTYSDSDYDILSLIADDDATIAKVNAYRRARTIENILPLTYPDYNITISNQSGNEKCEGSSLCLGIKNLGSLTEDSAIELLRNEGYDPGLYKILYSEVEDEN